jgi:predicted PurR-regulated permease PerM
VAENRLVDLDGPDAIEPDGRRLPAEQPVDDEEFVRRDHDARPLPAGDGTESHEGGGAEQHGAGDGERQPARHEQPAGEGESDGRGERPCENDAMPACVDEEQLFGGGEHLGRIRHACPPSCRATMPVVMQETARRAFVATAVAGAVVVVAIALWHIRVLIALLFLAFTIAAAMRPGVEWLRRRRIPRAGGIAIHYLALFAFLGLFLWAVVPRALDQVQQALGEAQHSTGVKHELLVGLESRLRELPAVKGTKLIDPALTITVRAFEVLVGIFFTLASAAYWIYERERAERLIVSFLPRRKRQVVSDTWNLIDLKLGAYVRGQLILVLFVATVLSSAFAIMGLPFWLLVGAFAGVVELIPVIGPLSAGALAISVGLTDSWQIAVAAGVAVLVVRMIEDYVIVPRVLGHAVGLTPLVVLVSVTAVGLLFGGFAVLLAIPMAAVAATLIDVIMRNVDPAEEEVPAVLFPAKDAESR